MTGEKQQLLVIFFCKGDKPMRNLFVQLNADDAGVVTMEYLVLGTLLGLGLIVGVHAVTSKINEEAVELGNAYGSLDQDYLTFGWDSCQANKTGSQAFGDVQSNQSLGVNGIIGGNIEVNYCDQ